MKMVTEKVTRMIMSKISDHEEKLATYLNSFIENIESYTYPRFKCCGPSSRGLFCECQNLLIPKEEWPDVIKEGKLKLPFDLDIILDDKKRSSSGFLGMVMLKANEGCRIGRRNNSCIKNHYVHEIDPNGTVTGTATLIDMVEGQDVPYYCTHKENGSGQIYESDTYLLFPSDKSIPLSSVSSKINRLVVLDCKWTKTSTIQTPQLKDIPQVHLDGDFVPMESYFWRWHNAGVNRCSTLEAIYFAALQVAITKKYSSNDVDNLIHLMWLFGITRVSTIKTAIREGKPNPFTVEGKDLQRSYRQLNKNNKTVKNINRKNRK